MHRIASIAVAAILAASTWAGAEVLAVTTPINANPAAFAASGDRDPATCGVATNGFTYAQAHACWPSATDSNGHFEKPGRYIVRRKGRVLMMSVSTYITDRSGRVVSATNRDAFAMSYGQWFGEHGYVDTWDGSIRLGVSVGGHGYWGQSVKTDWVSPYCSGFGGSCSVWWSGVVYNGTQSNAGANFGVSLLWSYDTYYCRTTMTDYRGWSAWCA